jgi:cytochrome c peroxidase
VKAIRLLAAAVLALAAASASAADGPAPRFDATERASIESLGPWPPPPARDAGNPVSGQPAAIAFGARLFVDKRLSRDGTLACVSCHLPALALADGRARSFGRIDLDRNAPSLLNAGQQRWLGWDGAADSLWSQAIRVILDPREFGHSAADLQQRVRSEPDLACGLRAAFGDAAALGDGADPERTLVQLAQALGAFVATLRSPRTPFDRFRDALVRGDAAGMAPYPTSAQRGLKLFIGRGRCVLCHSGPMFGNGEFADIGVPFFVRPGVVDPGRHAGIAALKASRFNLLGPWAVLADAAEATKTRHVHAEHRHFGEFKVPSLRHVAATAPYMHNGSLPTLEAVLRHYDELNLERLHADGERILQPLRLAIGERADLLAFLRSLGDGRSVVPAAAAFRPGRADPCRRPSAAPGSSRPRP